MAMVTTMGYRKSVFFVAMIMTSSALTAGEWHVTPSIKLTESYSDNLLGDQDNKTSSWITELTPGLRVSGQGKNLDLNLVYQLSDVSYQAQNDSNDTYDYYQGDVLFKLFNNQWRTRISADKGRRYSSLASGILSAQNAISPNQSILTNYIIDSSFRSKVSDLFIYKLGVTANKSYDNGLNSQNNEAYGANAYLGNQPSSSSSYWHLSANYRELTRNPNSAAIAQDFSDYQAELGISLIDDFWLFASYFDQINNIDTTSLDLNSSSFGGGVRWKPSDKIDLKISYNKSIDKKNSDFTSIELTLKPSKRSSLYFTTGKRYYGNYYKAMVNYRLKRFSASIDYNEQITSYNLSQFQTPSLGSLICPKGQNFNINDCSFSSAVSPILKPDQQLIKLNNTLSDNNTNTYLEKKFSANINYTKRKVRLSLSHLDSKRNELGTNADKIYNESITTLTASYRFNSRANLGVDLSYRENETVAAQTIQSKSKDRVVSLSYHYKFSRTTTGKAILSNSQRVVTGSLASFTENRISFAFTKEF